MRRVYLEILFSLARSVNIDARLYLYDLYDRLYTIAFKDKYLGL